MRETCVRGGYNLDRRTGLVGRFYEMMQRVTSCPEPERSSSIGTSKGVSVKLEVEFFANIDVESGDVECTEKRELRSEKKSMAILTMEK